MTLLPRSRAGIRAAGGEAIERLRDPWNRGRALDRCLNCDAKLTGLYCHDCGQRARDLRRPIWELLRDFVHETFDIDGRFTRSLGPFFLRPGQLTLAYNEGRRVQYISPVRLFLFATLIFFVVSSPSCPLRSGDDAVAKPSPEDFESKDGRLRRSARPVDGDRSERRTDRLELGDGSELVLQRSAEVVRLWLTETSEPEYYVVARELPDDGWRTWFARRLGSIGERVASRDPRVEAAFADTMLQNFARSVFVLVPLYALLLLLFVRRPRRTYVEHLVMSLHVHSFVFVVFSVISLVSAFFPEHGMLVQLLLLGVTVYVVAAFRRAYVSTTTRALMRAVGVFLVYLVVLAPVMFAVFLVSMAMFE